MKNYLTAWYANNDAEKRTVDLFWRCFESYKNDDFDEFCSVFSKDKENVKIELDRLSYELNLPELSNEFISVCIDIYVEEKKVGWFKQYYSVDGEPYDEYFVID